MTDICFWSALRLAEAIRNKEISAAEVVDKHLARIKATSPSINAVVQLAAERAEQEARRADAITAKGESMGAFHGVPITIKDSLDSAGIISTAGALMGGFQPPETGTEGLKFSPSVPSFRCGEGGGG